MRTHRVHAAIAPWSVGTCGRDPAGLAVVRVEPVEVLRRTMLAVDLAFCGEGGTAVLPGVLADLPRLLERDRDPLVWPAAAELSDAQAQALAALVVPLLEPLAAAARIEEQAFRLATCAWFDAARDAGCFGAAPLRESLRRLAPYRWARRFARGANVRIDAPDAVGGWALLRDVCEAGVAPARRDPAAERWYGRPPAAPASCALAIVDGGAAAGEPAVLRLDVDPRAATAAAVDALPLDVGFAFDPAEGPPARFFALERAPERRAGSALAYGAAGGSSGRIAVVLGRPDALTVPSADTGEAAALAGALRAEGFAADLHAGGCDPAAYDLVHLMGVRDGGAARALADAARRARVPLAVHAYDEDAAAGGWWGAAVTRWCFEYGFDEADVGRYLDLLRRRAVALGEIRAEAAYAPEELGAAAADAVLRDAAVVFALSEAEAQVIRTRCGRRGAIAVVPPLAAAAPPEPVAALAGSGPYALVHAPIGPGGNQLLAARAAAQARIPLLLAGPVVDASYLELVRAFGGPDLSVVGEPSAGETTSLYAQAALVLDPAWVGDGGARLAAAALAGTTLALADRRRVELPGARALRFDPADVHALARALGEAWDLGRGAPAPAPAATLAALDPGAALRAIVAGYALAVPA